MLYLTTIKTSMEYQLQWFLNGSNLPLEMGQLVVDELAPEEYLKESYKDLIGRVKIRLMSDCIVRRGGILYVDYKPMVTTSKAELATLVRFINIRYDGNYTIIMNHEEVLYIPEDYKNNSTIDEVMVELAACIKRDKTLNIKAMQAMKIANHTSDSDLDRALNDMSLTDD